jgi:hypothetical protein
VPLLSTTVSPPWLTLDVRGIILLHIVLWENEGRRVYLDRLSDWQEHIRLYA